MKGTSIQWTTNSFSPWWGCTRVSPACLHCYAEAVSQAAGFTGKPPSRDPEGETKPVLWDKNSRRFFVGPKMWNEVAKWDAEAGRTGVEARVFTASMADVFEVLPPGHPDAADMEAARRRLWDLIEATPNLTWQLLTKRVENVAELVPPGWMRDGFPSHVWLGATVEDKPRADQRIPVLLALPAQVRFLSIEPLLGDLSGVSLRGVDWVLLGGESGSQARPFDLDHARKAVRIARRDGAALFIKQLGRNPTEAGMPYWRAGNERPSTTILERGKDGVPRTRTLKDWHGKTYDRFPEDLRIREFPTAKRERAGDPHLAAATASAGTSSISPA